MRSVTLREVVSHQVSPSNSSIRRVSAILQVDVGRPDDRVAGNRAEESPGSMDTLPGNAWARRET